MLIFRYLTAEVLKSQLAVFLTLMTIFVSQKFVVILSSASEGSIPGKMVLAFLALKLPQLASLILPLSIFLGIILAYSRIYADSEMTVLRACGVSEWYVVRVTLVSSAVMAVLAAVLTLGLAPWASEKEYQLREQADAESGLSALRAGRFQQTGNEKAVVFVHNIDNGGTDLHKVFVAQLPNKDSNHEARIVYAQTGKVLESDSGEQQLLLGSGKRYESEDSSLAVNLTEFSSYQVQIREQAIEHQRRKLEAVPTHKLLEMNTTEAIAQFQWRIAIPLAIPLLTLIAVPLSVVNPRQGKFAKLVPAISLYLGYFILLNAARFAVADGKIPTSIGLWWIHLSALFIGAYLIVKGRPFGVWLRAVFLRREKLA
ncbi:LPS export ABC transporter permease LptF [Pseudoalteromonas fenneropenaei]|uniref:Lipopolysaccharide export system permease protein LptF n=1 Tax=Pseudoalteromonas fenneropenaei TaxID=1737459 RepID=A0ABV7CKM7_9GAMM